MSNVSYPQGVSHRRPRPRRDRKTGATLLGALAGLALARHPAGVLAGGLLGHSSAQDEPVPFAVALQDEFARAGCNLVEVYRRGPFVAEALFDINGHFWTLQSQAPQAEGWNADNLEDWLFGDLIEIQLPQKLSAIQSHQRTLA